MKVSEERSQPEDQTQDTKRPVPNEVYFSIERCLEKHQTHSTRRIPTPETFQTDETMCPNNVKTKMFYSRARISFSGFLLCNSGKRSLYFSRHFRSGFSRRWIRALLKNSSLDYEENHQGMLGGAWTKWSSMDVERAG